jgi:hypothetical protein
MCGDCGVSFNLANALIVTGTWCEIDFHYQKQQRNLILLFKLKLGTITLTALLLSWQ